MSEADLKCEIVEKFSEDAYSGQIVIPVRQL